jgi:hypothetical protein
MPRTRVFFSLARDSNGLTCVVVVHKVTSEFGSQMEDGDFVEIENVRETNSVIWGEWVVEFVLAT